MQIAFGRQTLTPPSRSLRFSGDAAQPARLDGPAVQRAMSTFMQKADPAVSRLLLQELDTRFFWNDTDMSEIGLEESEVWASVFNVSIAPYQHFLGSEGSSVLNEKQRADMQEMVALLTSIKTVFTGDDLEAKRALMQHAAGFLKHPGR